MPKTLTIGATPALIHDEHVLELVQSMDRLTGRWTELYEALRGLTVNGVLALETIVLDADGQAQRDWSTPAAAIMVYNSGWGDVVVSFDPPRRDAPSAGPGRISVRSGAAVVVPCATRTLTFYGRAGEKVQLVATTRTLPPSRAFGHRAVKAVVLAAGNLFTGPGIYAGFTVRETAGANATVDLYDNATAGTGTPLETISLGPRGSAGDLPEGLVFTNGIYAVITGTVIGSVRIS